MSQERTEKLAVALFDLDRVDDLLIKKILGGKISKEVEKCKDEIVVPLTCGLETAALAIDVLRSENRREGVQVVRAYIDRLGDGQWSKLPDNVVLTVPFKGRHVLSPNVFPRYESSLESVPLSAERIDFGGGK